MAKASRLKGRNLMIFTGENGTDEDALVPLALCTNTTVTFTAETEDEKTKDDSIAANPEVTSTSWEATSEMLYAYDGGDIQLVTTELVEMFNAAAQVPVIIGIPTNKSDGDVPDAGWTVPASTEGSMAGTAIITSLEIDAPVEGKATCSITFTGVGSLDLITE